MNKRERRSRIGLAFAGIGAGLLALITPNAQASQHHNHADDCRLVAKNDRTLCARVQGQRAYGWTLGSGAVSSSPNGRTIVHDITHQGLTRGEMRTYLQGEAAQYREHITHVSVNVDRLPSRGCQYIVKVVKRDGVRVTQTLTVCP